MSRKRDTIVIGQQMADARKAEFLSIAQGTRAQSPMPNVKYDAEAGDSNLVSVSPLPIDEKLRILTDDFRQSESDKREQIRKNISMDEFYTLIHFAKRSAALALKDSSPEPCQHGVIALAIIDEARIDQRDAAWAAALLSYAISATAENRSDIFDSAIEISTPGMGQILRRFRHGANLSEWGYAEIQTDSGSGLIASAWGPYAPTLPLGEMALTVAAWLNGGRYVVHPTIAVEVPAVWFAAEFRDAARSALASATGAVSIEGRLRRSVCRESDAQMFLHWLVELPSQNVAEKLVSYVGNGSHMSGRFVVGYSTGRLFGLLVAGSTAVGVSPYESLESLTDLMFSLQALIEAGS